MRVVQKPKPKAIPFFLESKRDINRLCDKFRQVPQADTALAWKRVCFTTHGTTPMRAEVSPGECRFPIKSWVLPRNGRPRRNGKLTRIVCSAGRIHWFHSHYLLAPDLPQSRAIRHRSVIVQT